MGNISVFGFDSNQILFKFCLGSSKGGVESSQLSVFWCNFTKFGFSNFLSVIGLLENLTDLSNINFKNLDFADHSCILFTTSLQIHVCLIQSCSQFHDLLLLSLGSQSQLTIALVASIQRHFKFSNSDSHLLLDFLNFILQLSLSFTKSDSQSFNFNNHFLANSIKFILFVLHVDISRLTKFFEFQFKLLDALFQADLQSIGVLVSSGQFLAIMSQFSVFLFNLMQPLFQSFQINLVALKFILQFSFGILEAIPIHICSVQFIGKFDNILGSDFAVFISLFIQVSHLTQFDGNFFALAFDKQNFGIQILNSNLRMFKILDKNSTFLLHFDFSLFGRFQFVDGVFKTKNLPASALFQIIQIQGMLMYFIFILGFPVFGFISEFANSFLQVNTKDAFFFIFDSDLLDFDFQILDGSFSTHLNPG